MDPAEAVLQEKALKFMCSMPRSLWLGCSSLADSMPSLRCLYNPGTGALPAFQAALIELEGGRACARCGAGAARGGGRAMARTVLRSPGRARNCSPGAPPPAAVCCFSSVSATLRAAPKSTSLSPSVEKGDSEGTPLQPPRTQSQMVQCV